MNPKIGNKAQNPSKFIKSGHLVFISQNRIMFRVE
jgi:hypothetical protein